jgi:TonB family protein
MLIEVVREQSSMNRCLGVFVLCAVCFLPTLGCKDRQQPTPTLDSAKTPYKACRNVILSSPSRQEERLKRRVEPVYPQEAKDKSIRGTVNLHVIVGCEGKVEAAEVTSGDPLLAKSALQAVRQWEYKVTLVNGDPVQVDTMVIVKFP